MSGPTMWRWRDALNPAAGLWVATAVLGLRLGHRGGVDPTAVRRVLATAADELGRSPWPRITVGVLTVLVAWTAAGLLARPGAALVETLWRGQWGRLGDPLRSWRVYRWKRVQKAINAALAAGDSARSDRLVERRFRISVAPPERPTWIGDRWRALGTRVNASTRLDPTAAWPRLWQLLPPLARRSVLDAHAEYQQRTAAAYWGLLYGALGLVWWPAGVIGFVVLLIAVQGARRHISDYADQIEAAFDLYVGHLVEALRLPMPADGRITPDLAAEINARLRKGAGTPNLAFPGESPD